jgi:hypothetical protein
MPTSTDLVTDLPADFEVFGQAVDTDFVDLLGGANGYILSKASATDLDFAWIPNDQGDITAVNVTSPITGGGSAGAVTIGINAATTSVVGAVQLSDSTSTTSSVLASTPTATKAAYDLADTANTAAGAAQTTANAAIAKTTVTTAGDIIYRNATVPTRLGIGTAGQILQVNSGATAPEWTTISSASGLTKITSATFSGAATFVVNSCFSNTYRYYLIVGRIVASAVGNTTFKYRKAGTDLSTSYYYGGNRSDWSTNAVTASTGSNVSGINLGSFDSYNCGFIINTSNPYSGTVNPSISYQTPNTGQSYSTVGSGLRLATDTHDGFSIIPASGTLTGEVFIYGYSL